MTRAESAAHWITAAEQRHVLLRWRRDVDGKEYAVTGCGWMIWPSRYDARLPDPRVCLACYDRYGDRDND